MSLRHLLVSVVDASRRHALTVVLAGVIAALLSCLYAAGHLGVSTNTDEMFSSSLSWRQAQLRLSRDFPQFNDLLVVVVTANEREEAQATAEALAAKLRPDKANFKDVRIPGSEPFFKKEGLLFLDPKQLSTLTNKLINSQPFLGQLVADPTARGLFTALALIGMGAGQGQVDLTPYFPVLRSFNRVMESVLDGHPQPLSWQTALGGGLADLAGKDVLLLAQPVLNFGSLQPGGAATAAIRAAASSLPFVKSGDAKVRITGNVALADEEFSSVAQGAALGLLGSFVLITLWLILAVHSWRLIVPVLMTLALGLSLTLLFAAAAVGTLNLVSVGFGVLFVGIAVDFAIQFSVRYRERRYEFSDLPEALRQTAMRTGEQILVAACATAAGFLAFVPTSFVGVAELGLIAGVGMLIAFTCTIVFLPAAITLFHPPGEKGLVGFSWGPLADRTMRHWHTPILLGFGAAAIVAMVFSPGLTFDSNPLHTKNPNTEAMRTLSKLMSSPVTNPYVIDIMEPNVAAAASVAEKLRQLPTVKSVRSINSFVPDDQQQKLAIIADAQQILEPTLLAPPAAAPVTAAQIRMAAKTALSSIEPALPSLKPDNPLFQTAKDLKALYNGSDATLMATNEALTRFLPDELQQLRDSLSAGPVTLQSIPESVRRDWVLPDGQAKVEVVPKLAVSNTPAGLSEFVDQVTQIAPHAAGPAVTIEATSRTIVTSFRDAGIYALAAIAAILLLALRSLRDAALVMAPLLLSALLTLLIIVLIPLPLNYANIIALPLLLGVGVAFNIYFVMNWRSGRRALLASATARAIVFSALTTGTAFGSLALSHHPGTASMGDLLLISLGCTLLSSLVFIPALLAAIGRPHLER